MSTNSEKPPSYREVPDARILYEESLRFLVRFYVLRGLGVLAVVYVVNALFNLGESIVQKGFGGITFSDAVHALLLNDLAALLAQLPAQILAVLGVVALVFILLGRFWREHDRNELEAWTFFLKRSLEHRAQRIAAMPPAHPEKLTHPVQAADEVSDAIERLLETRRADGTAFALRSQHYVEIEKWLKEDPELVDLVAHLVNKARFWRNLGIAVLIPAAAVVGARLLVLWHHR